MATLFHWDLPAALDDRGGWLNPDIAGWFADYASTVFRRLDDRVKLWATLNEPWVVTDGGYLHGALAPGHRNRFEAPIATHNLLRAHGAAVSAYRSVGKHHVGIVVNLEPKYPRRPTPPTSGRAARGCVHESPVPRSRAARALSGRAAGDLRRGVASWPARGSRSIAQPIDFIGINYYTRNVTRFDATCMAPARRAVRQELGTYTETGWEVFEQALTDLLLRVKARYGNPPVYITENGAAFYDPPWRRTDAWRIRCAWTTCDGISPPSTLRAPRARMCAGISSGRCSTISNGRSDTPSASGSCT
jgi:beta-glucosidase